ncbi:hypothetical protein SAMN05519103_06655 [Rhizobiales bacterium GAS113]|nr:hypothetical protein SAMN05519103_06655 [Rhizobiales bacterium GAS113]
MSATQLAKTTNGKVEELDVLVVGAGIRRPLSPGSAAQAGHDRPGVRGRRRARRRQEDMAAAFATPLGAEAGGKLLEDEKKFLDERTLILMTREYLIFDRS